MRKFATIVFILLSVSLYAQREEGLQYVKKLASPTMYGRGYVNDGIHIAEKYIITQFKQFGIKPFQYYNGYTQEVIYPVNTFPKALSLTIDGTELKPGEDFIIEAISAGGTKKQNCYLFTKKDLQDICTGNNLTELEDKIHSKYANHCLVFDETDTTLSTKDISKINNWLLYLTMKDKTNGSIIRITKQKLTQNIAGVCGSIPYFIVSDKCLKTHKPKAIQFDVTQELDTVKANNIFGFIQGTDSTKKAIVFTAHYDHIGMIGQNTTFCGANDNASGMAMLLTLANYYSKNQPKQDIIFVALCGEELGLIGSKEAANDFPIELDGIQFLINIDLVGTGDDGICVVNGKIFTNEFEKLKRINDEHHFFKAIRARGEACNSDHCPFYQKNVPCFYIYTQGGTQAYHDIYDTADQLPLTKFNEYFQLITEFIND